MGATDDAGRRVGADGDMAVGAHLGDRLDLLERTEEVTSLARELTDVAIQRIEGGFGVVLDEHNAGQLVTHLAVALSRLDRGEPLTTTLAVVDDELREHERQHRFARDLLGDLGARLGRPVPDAEVSYLTLHLCALTT
jgi:transcriptional regulatory protein LevR